jgi:hypothetical protein
MDGWSGGVRKGKWTGKPKFSAEKYIEIFKKADAVDMPITINLASTPYITTNAPFFNPACMEIMKQVRKAVKGY